MGLVLAFQTSSRSSSSRPTSRRRDEPARSADILFFTGVRYERQGDAAVRSAGSATTLGQPVQ